MAVEILKKWDGTLEVGKNDTGYYSCEEVLEFFNIGPAILECYLKEYKDIIIPLYNSNDKDILDSKYYWLEVRELDYLIRKNMKKKNIGKSFGKYTAPNQ